MMGKNIEHSGRLVIVPNYILKPYQIGLPAKTIKEINFLELAYYQTEMISKQSADSSMITTFAKNSINVFNAGESINISDNEFHNFIKSKKADLVYVCERAPVLWKYNVTAFTLGFYTNDHEDAKRKMKPTKTTKFNYRLKNRTTSKED